MAHLEKKGLPANPNHTVAQLSAKAEQVVTESFAPSAMEKVGFGKHGDATLGQVVQEHPSYIQWRRTTMAEDDSCSWRLKRLVLFAESKQTIAAGKGYPKPPGQNMAGPKEADANSLTSSDFSVVSSVKGEAPSSSSSAKTPTASASEAENMQLRKEVQDLKDLAADLSWQTGRSKNRK